MALYIADQFAELMKYDPAQDRMVTGAGRRIVAVRAESTDEAYARALREAEDVERSYLQMCADTPKYFREKLGMSDELVNDLLPLPQPAFDHYRLLGVGNATSRTRWVDDVHELMDEFTYDPEFVDFYRCVRSSGTC